MLTPAGAPSAHTILLSSITEVSQCIYILAASISTNPVINIAVVCYPFDDHNAPPFTLIQPFCEDVAKYLGEDERFAA